MNEWPQTSWATYWGVFGFLFLLVQAIYRLTPLALEPLLEGQATGGVIALYLISIAFNAYAEGYRGFQMAAAPRVVARAMWLGREPRPLHAILAPLFCMALFHATRRRLIVSWLLYIGIVALIVLVRQLQQPWRGVVDAGVVVGLTWGAIAVLIHFARALSGGVWGTSPELPDR